MAEATKSTREVVVLTLSPEEARTIFDVLHLTEVQDFRTDTAKNISRSIQALGSALDWPPHRLRVDFDNIDNSDHTVYIFEND